MTLDHLAIGAVLGMLASGIVVYSVAEPRPRPLALSHVEPLALVSAPPATDESAAPLPVQPTAVVPEPSPVPVSAAPVEPTAVPIEPNNPPTSRHATLTKPQSDSGADGPRVFEPKPVVSGAPAFTSPILFYPTATAAQRPTATDALASAASAELIQLAGREVAGMMPTSAQVRGMLEQGATLEAAFQLQPGKCYAAIASSGGITELDLALKLDSPGLPSSDLVTDTSKGSNAVVAGKGNCYKWSAPLAAPAKFVVKASIGRGYVFGFVFAK